MLTSSLLSKPILIFLILLVAAPCRPQVAAKEVSITIRLINGKNGNPIRDENLNVFRNGSKFAENFRADHDGLIHLSIGSEAVVEFGSNIQVTCHPYKVTAEEKRLHLLGQFKVSDIMQRGISDENMCSKRIKVIAKPGEFIFFERPPTFLEGMNF